MTQKWLKGAKMFTRSWQPMTERIFSPVLRDLRFLKRSEWNLTWDTRAEIFWNIYRPWPGPDPALSRSWFGPGSVLVRSRFGPDPVLVRSWGHCSLIQFSQSLGILFLSKVWDNFQYFFSECGLNEWFYFRNSKSLLTFKNV